jgi:hypothetical protein
MIRETRGFHVRERWLSIFPPLYITAGLPYPTTTMTYVFKVASKETIANERCYSKSCRLRTGTYNHWQLGVNRLPAAQTPCSCFNGTVPEIDQNNAVVFRSMQLPYHVCCLITFGQLRLAYCSPYDFHPIAIHIDAILPSGRRQQVK